MNNVSTKLELKSLIRKEEVEIGILFERLRTIKKDIENKKNEIKRLKLSYSSVPLDTVMSDLDQVIRYVYRFQLEDIMSRSREKPLSNTRKAVCNFAVNVLGYKMTDVARFIGYDKTSVMHMLDSHNDFIDKDEDYKNKYVRFSLLVSGMSVNPLVE
jgi:chromosomal replication initiation ATPase DnaA